MIVKSIGSYKPTVNLTSDELTEYEKKYLNYVEEKIKVIVNSGKFNKDFADIIFDKFIAPFQYWLENELTCELLNKKNANK